MIRKHFIFSGRVQEVGFRFKTYRKALTLSLTGYVRNLYDGSVEAEVQGEPLHIELLLDHLRNDRFISIDSMEVKEIKVIENEKTFVMK